MAFTTFTSSIALLIIFLAVRWLLTAPRSTAGTHLPPGPRGKPIIGNLLDIPPYHSWLKFKDWGDQFGPLFRFNLAGREQYVVSTEEVANDLLRQRGNIYSSREQPPAAAQLLSKGLRILFMPYNDTWRAQRRTLHLLGMSSAATSYQPTQSMESVWMIENLMSSPEYYERWFERYSSGIIFRLAFGRRIVTGEEQEVRRIYDVVHNVERIASPGAYLVDTFPFLMNLPAAVVPFKREIARLHKEELSLFRQLRDEAAATNGSAPECWAQTISRKGMGDGLSSDLIAYLLGSIFEAGSGTTAAAMMSLLLAMTLHPDSFRALQDEVDRVVGDERLPEFEDLPLLPMVRATAKEVLRWRPVTAGGVPHKSTKDDTYNGFFIPAGTTIHANQWAIHRDAGLYPDPESFLPERWLSPKYPTYREPLTIYPNLQGFSAFGFGRRICPFLNIAERSLNILTARIAWACDISKKKDVNGQPIEPPLYDYTRGINAQPKKFPFELKARSKERRQVVMNEAAKARENDPLNDHK